MNPPATPKPPARRFTLLDGMILIGSAAGALGLTNSWWYSLAWAWSSLVAAWASPQLGTTAGISWALLALARVLTPFALTSTAAALAARALKPRPRWRRLACQPGWMASLAATLGLAIGYAFASASYAWTGPYTRRHTLTPPEDGMYEVTFLHAALPIAGLAVLVAWATLAANRRWRAEPTWVDRFGRLVGLAWIALGLLGLVLNFDSLP